LSDALGLGDTSGSVTLNGGTLDLNGKTVTIGALAGAAGAVVENGNAAAVTFTVGNGAAGTSVFGGVVQDGAGGAVSLTKTGVGTLALTGANAYSGTTTVSDGILRIGNNGATGAVPAGIVNNAAVVFWRSDAIAFSDAISGTGSLEKKGA
jgi:autotransporter-associated beta strand protein